MTFISYAQNYEDVMLHRALKHVAEGFYVDVGANDPEVDSVTRAFYESGWRGINIEPVDQWFERLQAKRPYDINLHMALGAHEDETVTLTEVVGTGLSTTDSGVAGDYAASQDFAVVEHAVASRTLTAVLAEHAHGEVHFLKIDVEGGEAAVLAGLDLARFRPWILVVEATLPNSQIQAYQGWEPGVLAAGYHFVYFDGLNRFYVADEHAELDAAFASPPNTFDGFVRVTEDFLRRQCDWQAATLAEANEERERQAELIDCLQKALASANRDIEDKARQLAETEAALEAARQELQGVYASRSWRWSAPLRWLTRVARALRGR